MKTYQSLEIHLDNENYQGFVDELNQLVTQTDWKVRQDFIDNYKKNSFSEQKIITCLESPEYTLNKKNIKGALWMWNFNGYLEVFNIIPLIDNSLDYDEYNYILKEFFNKFILNLKQKFNASIILSKAEKQIIETIGEDALKALVAFSHGANKSTGNTHPLDFNRWCDFVFIVFRNNIELGVSELIDWFQENGWSEDMAHKLGLEYEYSLDLLVHYEQNN
ncbi:MAG: hypothetical protein GZ091_14615 [Paludibacter sp.]|nr:hypothetical protein [Paludibacter sp.]